MEVFYIIQVEFSLVLGHPGAEGVVNVSGLLPLLLLNLRAHVPPGDEGDDDGEDGAHANSCDVSVQHGQLSSSVGHEGSSGETSWEGAGEAEPHTHTGNSSPHHTRDDSVAGGSGPQDGDCDGDDRGGDEDAGEVVGPGEVEVDSPAEQAEGDGEEGGDDDAPVLVVEQVLLILFVVLVDGAGVVRLHDVLALGSDHGVLLQ